MSFALFPDSVARINNACAASLLSASLLYSHLIEGVLCVLRVEGYIKDYSVKIPVPSSPTIKMIDVDLKYSRSGESCICPGSFKLISRPGRRMYTSVKDLHRYIPTLGVVILSTSRGVLSDRDAKKMNVGGELLCSLS